MEVKVLFFGVLTELAAADIKIYSGVSSLDDLIHRVIDEVPEIANFNFRIALNNEFIEGNPELNNGDEVAFMPPFAGG
jgi:molybdopterin converting factor small subunit